MFRAQLDQKFQIFQKCHTTNTINKINYFHLLLTVNAHEKLEVADKTASDRELEVSALARQVQLLQETTKVTQDRLDEILEKLPVVEKNLEENERTRKVFEAKSFQNEEKAELQEGQLIDAVQIAEESNRKFDDVQRKLKMVEDELNAKVEKAEEYRVF